MNFTSFTFFIAQAKNFSIILNSIIISMEHKFEQSLGDSEGQGSLACYSSWGHRVGHDLVTEQQWKSRGILGAVETFLPGGRLCKRRVCL